MQAVDRAMQDVFQSLAMPPLTITDPVRSWNGSVMEFSLTAQMGFLKNPIRGTVEVTDREVIIEADLGLFGRLVSTEKVQTVLESRVRGLLT